MKQIQKQQIIITQPLNRISTQTEYYQTPPNLKIFFYQFIGVTLLTWGINNSVYTKFQDIFISTAFFTAIIFSAPFSGGHVNPAVTIGFLNKKMPLQLSKAFIYWIAQLFGGIFGAYMGMLSTGQINAPGLGQQNPQYLISDLIGEFIGTFVFVFFILLITDQRTNFSPSTLASWVYMAGALYIGRLFAKRSGGCLNPAVAFGMILLEQKLQDQGSPFKRAGIFMIGPILGGYLGGIFYEKYVGLLIEKRKEEMIVVS